jgi:hypothetical protein
MKKFKVESVKCKVVEVVLPIALAAVLATATVALVAAFAGCTSGEYTGSRTIVGEQKALPELSDSSDSVSLRVYEDVKGAKVWTAKDCNVTIDYTNAYTNVYCGVLDFRNYMTLHVKIEPCEVTPTARESETSGEEPPPDGGAEDSGLKPGE